MTRLFIIGLLLPLLCCGFSRPVPLQKIITIQVNENGKVFIDRIAIESDQLPREVQQRLWRSYMSTGKMPQAIRLDYAASISPELRKSIEDGTRLGQGRTLTVLSLHKHKKKYEDLSNSKKEKIKKQYPVLFQKLS
ncbi:MAG TPA: hypothetical protein VFO70_04695 [Chitinophagaceae bacterium]|nr:hypothetical protein [Chitinophagaceae bacterium]